MTKIAISPNVNGTGTFTLAAPDSNTDRTLTLPDAGGEVFSQGNIIGTVSQSAGVPTGAIIQRGSNSNGEFVRFADGTQICHRYFETDAFNPVVWTFPAAFSQIPSIGATAQAESSIRGIFVSYFLPSTTGAEFNRFDDSSFPENAFFSASAIGRWF